MQNNKPPLPLQNVGDVCVCCLEQQSARYFTCLLTVSRVLHWSVTLWKRDPVIALCIVVLFSPLFELFVVFNSAFHFPFPLGPFS